MRATCLRVVPCWCGDRDPPLPGPPGDGGAVEGVVVDVDLKSLVGGYNNFVHYFRNRVLRSLSGLALTANELQTCYVCSDHLRNKTTATWASHEDLDSYLQFFFTTTDTALGVDFPGLIEFLELLALQRPEVGPVVILRVPVPVRDIGGEVLLSEIFRKLESKKQGRSLASIFVESATYTWVDPDHFLRSSESFRPYLVSHMDLETTRKELVDVLQGHAGSLDTIFHYVRARMPLHQAVEAARSVAYRRLLAGLAKAPPGPQLRRCQEELERLRSHNWSLVAARPLANPQLRFLIENNILFVSEPWVAIPQHVLMRWAIDLFLSLRPPDDETQEGIISPPAGSSIHL